MSVAELPPCVCGCADYEHGPDGCEGEMFDGVDEWSLPKQVPCGCKRYEMNPDDPS